MRHRWRQRASRREAAEVNVTAFLNLMVVLVPFLLITAVFSRITILELNLPSANAEAQSQDPRLRLEVIVRRNAIEVVDRGRGLLGRIQNATDGHNLAELSRLLQRTKKRYPEALDASILIEPEVIYDELVQVMDRVRIAEVVGTDSIEQMELFPQIAIGDAPPIVKDGTTPQ
jgi:biopolymer transport protein ExbD